MKKLLNRMPLSITELTVLLFCFILTIPFFGFMILIDLVVIIVIVVRFFNKGRKEHQQISNEESKLKNLQANHIPQEQNWQKFREISLFQTQELAQSQYALVKGIFDDQEKIQQMIEKADLSNRQEVRQIQSINFERFIVILHNYLKIAHKPSDFEDVERRLQEGESKMKSYAEKLRELVRKYNEEGMKEFEIALRQMEGGE